MSSIFPLKMCFVLCIFLCLNSTCWYIVQSVFHTQHNSPLVLYYQTWLCSALADAVKLTVPEQLVVLADTHNMCMFELGQTYSYFEATLMSHLCVSPRWTARCLRTGNWFRGLHLGSPSCSGWIWNLWWWWASLRLRSWGPQSQLLGLRAPRSWWSGASSWQRLCNSTLPLSCHSSLLNPSSCCMKLHPEPGERWDIPRHQVNYCLRVPSFGHF